MTAKSSSKSPKTKTPRPAAKPRVTAAAKPAAEKPPMTASTVAVAPEPKVKRGEFVARVAERANLRPNQVKPVLEAVLAEMGALLVKGETLSHPALGKLSVNRHKELPNADVVVCKLRRAKPAPADQSPDPLATAAE